MTGLHMNQRERTEILILKFIDAYVDLNQHINSTVLINQFSINRTKASEMMTKYLDEKPSNLRYVHNAKCYNRTYTFKLHFLTECSSLTFLNAVEVAFNANT